MFWPLPATSAAWSRHSRREAATPQDFAPATVDRQQIEDEIERLIGVLDAMEPDPDLEPSLGGDCRMPGRPDSVDLEGDCADDEPEFGWTVFESRFNSYPPDTTSGEPSLGSLECLNQDKWSDGGIADLEKDDSDDEPSLGSCEVNMPAPYYHLGGGHGHCLFPALYREPGSELRFVALGFQQISWADGFRHDQEEEHDGREPCCEDKGADSGDDEPSLGASEPAWLGPSCGSTVKILIARNLRPDLWEGAEPERANALSQAGWAAGSGDDREVECEDEGAQCDDEGAREETGGGSAVEHVECATIDRQLRGDGR